MTALLLAVLAASVPTPAPDHQPTEPPPDVVHGEHYDGRVPDRSITPELLQVPRLLLAPPRLLVAGLGVALRPPLDFIERTHATEQVIAAVSSDDGLIGVRPVIDYQTHFRPIVGLLFFDHRLPRKSTLHLQGEIGGPDILVGNGKARIPLWKNWKLGTDFDYVRRSDQFYTGIGMEGYRPYSRYGVNQVDGAFSLYYTPTKTLRFDAAQAFGWRRFNDGRFDDYPTVNYVYCGNFLGHCLHPGVDDRLVPRFNEGTQFARSSVALHADSRPDSLSTGVMTDVVLWYSHGLGSDPTSYLEIRGHLGTQIDLWRHRTLSLNVTAVDEVRFGKTPIPFSELVTLGGPDDLRGFRLGRLRDQSSVLASLEYAWPIWMWLDGSIFTDTGGVFGPNFTGLDYRQLRWDLGVGVHARVSNKYIFRMQLAYGFGADGGVMFVFKGEGSSS